MIFFPFGHDVNSWPKSSQKGFSIATVLPPTDGYLQLSQVTRADCLQYRGGGGRGGGGRCGGVVVVAVMRWVGVYILPLIVLPSTWWGHPVLMTRSPRRRDPEYRVREVTSRRVELMLICIAI